MPVVDVFRALGEPTRLKMVERLSDGEAYTMTSVSKGLKISRQGSRKHLQILADAKIVTLIRNGRDTLVVLDRHSLDKGKDFIAKLESQWEKRLEALRDVVEKGR